MDSVTVELNESGHLVMDLSDENMRTIAIYVADELVRRYPTLWTR
jgi:hypothetical protein